MLIIQLKVNERVFVGENITITIAKTHGKKTDLGISAPRNLLILREELIQKQKELKNG